MSVEQCELVLEAISKSSGTFPEVITAEAINEWVVLGLKEQYRCRVNLLVGDRNFPALLDFSERSEEVKLVLITPDCKPEELIRIGKIFAAMHDRGNKPKESNHLWSFIHSASESGASVSRISLSRSRPYDWQTDKAAELEVEKTRDPHLRVEEFANAFHVVANKLMSIEPR